MKSTKTRHRLIECRKAKGKEKGSRETVATGLGISVVYLRMIETGAHTPGRDLMIRFAGYYGEPLEVLFPDLFGDDQAV